MKQKYSLITMNPSEKVLQSVLSIVDPHWQIVPKNYIALMLQELIEAYQETALPKDIFQVSLHLFKRVRENKPNGAKESPNSIYFKVIPKLFTRIQDYDTLNITESGIIKVLTGIQYKNKIIIRMSEIGWKEDHVESLSSIIPDMNFEDGQRVLFVNVILRLGTLASLLSS